MATLIGLLASSGLRSGEVVGLDRSDVDLTNGVLLVRKTKFRKDRLVPVHTTTQAALGCYARERDRFSSSSSRKARTRSRSSSSSANAAGFFRNRAAAKRISMRKASR